MPRSVLILGANGRLGHALVHRFRAKGWRVVAQGRGAPPADLPVGVTYERTPIDAPGAWLAHYRSFEVVVHAVNPPYSRWSSDALPALEAAIDLALAFEARLLFPGNVYNFDAALPAVLTDDAPQAARSTKGRLRIVMEQRLEQAERWGLRAIVLRAGDFIGAQRPGGWFTDGILRTVDQAVLTYPGPMDQVHAWQDVDALAEVFEAVAEAQARFPAFARCNVPGLAVDGQTLLEATARELVAAGVVDPDIAIQRRSLCWPLLRAMGVLQRELRELGELRSLWFHAHRLDGARLADTLGASMPQAPSLDAVVRRAISRWQATRPNLEGGRRHAS